MPPKRRREDDASLILLGIFVIVLVAFLAWSMKTDNIIAGAFRIDDIQICEELDENMRPIPLVAGFVDEAKQACLWFEYSRAREGDMLEIVWLLDGTAIQRDSFRLSESRNTKAFYLMKEDGAPLSPGKYSVMIFCNSREKAALDFTVAEYFVASDEDVLSDDLSDTPEISSSDLAEQATPVSGDR